MKRLCSISLNASGSHGRLLPSSQVSLNLSAVPLESVPVIMSLRQSLQHQGRTAVALLTKLLMADNLSPLYNRRQAVTIDELPDEILLAIFDFYVVRYQDLDIHEVAPGHKDAKRNIESWQTLVHVCRRWRCTVFASPRRLNLQLRWRPRTSVRKTLNVWPAFPLLIAGDISGTPVDDAIAVLEHNDRICQITLYFDTTLQIEKLWTAVQVPFPELATLYLSFGGVSFVPVLPDSFLDGSAPRLQYLALTSVPFPGLPELLLSATHLVHLHLHDIPHSGYFSPEAMATCLTMLSNLERLQLRFESPQSSPDQENRHSPPPTRSLLPALTFFGFKGVHEYLEELVSRIDTPRLRELGATFFNDIDFDTPELIRFVSHSPIFKALNGATVCFGSQTASVRLDAQASGLEYFEVEILSREPNWQLSAVAQISITSSSLLSTTEDLFINERYNSQPDWKDGIENIEWLELLLPFTAVKNLYVSKQFASRITPALQEMTEGGTIGALSSLQNLYLEGLRPSVKEGLERFISARQFTNHPVAVSDWNRIGVGVLRPRAEDVQIILYAVNDIRFCEELFDKWMTELDKVPSDSRRRHGDLFLRIHLDHLKESASVCSKETNMILQYQVRFASLMAQRIDDASKSQYTVNPGPEATKLSKDINEVSGSLWENVKIMTFRLRSFVSTLEDIQVKVEKNRSRAETLLKAIAMTFTTSSPSISGTVRHHPDPKVREGGAPADTALGQAASEFRVTEPKGGVSENFDSVIKLLKEIVPNEAREAHDKLRLSDKALKIMERMRVGLHVDLSGLDAATVAEEWHYAAKQYQSALERKTSCVIQNAKVLQSLS